MVSCLALLVRGADHLDGNAAILAGIHHGTGATLLVAGHRREVDLHKCTADAGVAQATTDVIPLFDVAQFNTVAIYVQGVQGIGQCNFASGVVSAVVEHAGGSKPTIERVIQTRGVSPQWNVSPTQR